MPVTIAETFELLFDKNNNTHIKHYRSCKKKVKKRIAFMLTWIG